MTRWAAVLGSPIAHSLSPVLHATAYAALGVEIDYTARECDEPGLSQMISQVRDDANWVGLSLTMPLKISVMALLDQVDAKAEAIGAANTVVARDGGLAGYNTDIDGIVYALRQVAQDIKAPLVLGGGGTARAAIGALAARGVRETELAVRRPEAANELVAVGEQLGIEVSVLKWQIPDHVDIVISTTPAGAADSFADQPWPSDRALVELLYHPWPTALAATALAADASVVDGMAVLAGQAVGQVELFTGRTVDVELLRAAGERALAERNRDG